MLYYELKKITSRTANRIAFLCLAVLLAVVCFFAAAGVDYVNEEGETESGIAASRKLREAKKEWMGELTEERIAQVINANAEVNKTEEYRSVDMRKNDIAYGWKQGFSDIRLLLVYSYCAFRDYDYYLPDSLRPEDAAFFYKNRSEHLKEWLETEAKDVYSEEEKAFVIGKYEEMKAPLYYDYADGWKQLFEYAPTLLMIMVLILGFIAAGIFSCEFQSKADAVFFTAVHGRGRAVAAKMKAGFLVITAVYWSMVSVYTLTVLGILGSDGGGCMIQTGSGGWKSFYNITYIQEYLIIFIGGYIGSLFILVLTMLVSAVAKSAVLAVMVPFVLIFLPSFLSGSRMPFMGKLLGLMPDQLLQMNMSLVYMNIYRVAGKMTGAAELLGVLYLVLTAAVCPILYVSYKKTEVR